MKCIAFTNETGGVSIIHPAPQENVVKDFLRVGNTAMANTVAAMTYDQYVEWVRAKDVPVKITNPKPGTPAMMLRVDAERLGLIYTEIPSEVLNVSDLPTDRSTRDAWRMA